MRSTSDAWAPPFTCELDAVFDHDRTQEEVYAVLAEAAVEDFLRGINATIFAYGQTGTGKTYSMYGSEQALLPLAHPSRMQATPNLSPAPPPEQVLRDLSRAPPETYGSALKAVLRILAHLSSRPAARLQLAYLEVYNDTINDLLPRSDGQGKAAGHDLRLRENASEGVYVEGLQYCEVSSPQQVFTAIALTPTLTLTLTLTQP